MKHYHLITKHSIVSHFSQLSVQKVINTIKLNRGRVMLHMKRYETQLNKWRAYSFYFNLHFQLQLKRVYRRLGFARQLELRPLLMHKCDGEKLPCFRVNIGFYGIFPWLTVVVQLYSMVKGAKYKKTVWNNNNNFTFLRFVTRHSDAKDHYRENNDLGVFCWVLNNSIHLQRGKWSSKTQV